jgi:predicted DNA-binding protein (UPF0251 family)
MPRPRLLRRVWFQPNITYFKPAGIRLIDLEESVLSVDEFEAIRLKDSLRLEQEEAAKKMKISQPTFHRLLLDARKKIADAIVNGKAIRIEGGNFKMMQPRMVQGRGMGGGIGGGGGMGQGGGMGSGGGMGGGRGMGGGMGQGRGQRRGMGGGQGRGRMGGFAAGPQGICKCPKCGYEQQHPIGQPCTKIKCPECGTMMIREQQ